MLMRSPQTTSIEVLTKELAGKIDTIITNYGSNSTKLVGILLEVQDIIPKQYLPLEVAAYISQKMNIPLSRIYDVISFYAALSDIPRADYVVQLCDSVVCKVTGNTALKDSLQELMGINVNEISADGKYALEPTACFGACDIAPAIRVNGRVYGNLTSKEKIKQVLDNYR
jgi:NADH:ubiquinone oxidoreductase subunit E